MLRKVRFHNYPGHTKYGNPCVYEVDFNERDLVQMLRQPLHLEKVSFRTGHQIWGEKLGEFFEAALRDHQDDCQKMADFINLGFVRGLAMLGYRVVPEKHEFQIL